MKQTMFAEALLVLLLLTQGTAQVHSPFPVDITAGTVPQRIMVDGRLRLVYELHLTSFAPWPVELMGVEVYGSGARPLASYKSDELEKLIVPVETLLGSAAQTDAGRKVLTIKEGHSAVMFADLSLRSGDPAPAELRHRFSFSFVGKNGTPVEKTVDSVGVAVNLAEPPVIRAPLRGSVVVAFNAFGNQNHRRSFNPVDGRVRIAQRFAIDWMCLGPDGRLFHDTAKSNVNFYSYGAEVLAVADARVSDLKDGLPDNAGVTERSSRIITLDNAVGNYVILDLGQGHFALYAHLQPGSLKVKVGEKVKAGQMLALLGNSGNSDEPHLHFQLMDGNSPLGSEGIPFELETFSQAGVLSDSDVLDTGQAWQANPHNAPVLHRHEFPVDNAVMTFP